MNNTLSKQASLMILVLSLGFMPGLDEALAGIGPFGGSVYSVAVDPAEPHPLCGYGGRGCLQEHQ